MVPVPAADDCHVTGYWMLPAPTAWAPAPELEAFLAHGGTVVSIGFGSMASDNAEAVTSLVVRAVEAAGVRAVLLSGWGGLRSIASERIFCADSLPHDWLFARVQAIVHHGGAGTTGAALRAGQPSIVVPFTMDQPFWGTRVAALGVGPKPIPRKKLTWQNLAGALQLALTDQAMQARAAHLGEQLRLEDGVAAAVPHFNELHS